MPAWYFGSWSPAHTRLRAKVSSRVIRSTAHRIPKTFDIYWRSSRKVSRVYMCLRARVELRRVEKQSVGRVNNHYVHEVAESSNA